MLCVLKVSHTLIKHLNKEVLKTGGGRISVNLQVSGICVQEVGGGCREAEWH